MMIKRWAVLDGAYKGAKVEAYKFSDGSIRYLFSNRIVRSMELSKTEAKKTIKLWGMQLVYEEEQSNGKV